MKPIELNIYTYGDDQLPAANLEIHIPLEDCELRKITFYNIDAVSTYKENEKEYTSVFAGGTNFIVDKEYNEVIELINKANGY